MDRDDGIEEHCYSKRRGPKSPRATILEALLAVESALPRVLGSAGALKSFVPFSARKQQTA
jgi:hypothetical protein